jgi:type I restriction enzyme M protein
VPEGVLFGSTGAHKELRRQLIENNRVEAVLSLPGGVFQPYSGVKTSVLFFRKGGSTERVLFLHADNDGYKLDANHDTPIEADDLPAWWRGLWQPRSRLGRWQARDPPAEWTRKSGGSPMPPPCAPTTSTLGRPLPAHEPGAGGAPQPARTAG